MRTASELTAWLDNLLDPAAFDDITYDGLQVEGKPEIRKAAFAVDSSQEIYDEAVKLGCDLLVVHHALIWRGWGRVAGMDRLRLKTLLASDTNLYVAHLPLDFHPEIGNNASIAALIGAKLTGEIFYGVGRVAEFGSAVTLDELVSRVESSIGKLNPSFLCGGKTVRRLGISSGGFRASKLPELAALGVDTLVTGEGDGASQFYHACRETKMSVLMAGHYATELTGIRSLMRRFAAEFAGVETVLIDKPTGW